jgi:RNA polymerase primary sigma factor
MDKLYELDLWSKWKKSGDREARRDLIRRLDPLLQKQVNKYVGSGLPREALETEAKRLTFQSLDNYDPSKAALNTHAVNHLKHLQRFVINYQNVGRIPENRALQITRFQSVKRNLIEDLGREPTTVELADTLKWNIREVERMENELRSDLSLVSGKDENYFEDTLFNTDESEEALEFVYYDEDNQGKLLIEYIFGKGGKPAIGLSYPELSKKTGLTEFSLRKKVKEIAKKIEHARNIGAF